MRKWARTAQNFVLFSIEPVRSVGKRLNLVISLVGISAVGLVGSVLGPHGKHHASHWPWGIAGVCFGTMVLFLIAGVRLQGQLEHPDSRELPDEHREELNAAALQLANRIAAKVGVIYEVDGVHEDVMRRSFHGHFPELASLVDEWAAYTDRAAELRQQLTAMLSDRMNQMGLTPPAWPTATQVPWQVSGLLADQAEVDELVGYPLPLQWDHPNPTATMQHHWTWRGIYLFNSQGRTDDGQSLRDTFESFIDDIHLLAEAQALKIPLIPRRHIQDRVLAQLQTAASLHRFRGSCELC